MPNVKLFTWMQLILDFSLTSLLSSFNRSTESSVLLASIKSAYFSVNRAGNPSIRIAKGRARKPDTWAFSVLTTSHRL